jgi:Photosynthesis system II assembly factor YCF48
MSSQGNDKLAGSRDNDSRRDVAIEKILSRHSGAIGSPATPCPDAEVLAAYVDRGLAENEAARWETHFATCERCQDVLGALAASAPAEELQPQLAVAAAASAAQPAQQNTAARAVNAPVVIKPVRSKKPFWVMGAAAVAAVFAYFIIFRGSQTPTNSQQSSSSQIATQNQNQPAAPPSDVANNGYVPVPQAADSKLPKTNANAGKTSKPLVNLQEATKEPQIPLNPVVSTQIGSEGGSPAQARATKSSSAGSASVAGGVAGGRIVEPSAQSVNSSTASVQIESKVAPAAPNPNAQSAQNRDEAAAASQGQVHNQLSEKRGISGAFKTTPPHDAGSPSDLSAVLIFSSQGSVAWSVGQNGRIDKSIDSGGTWQHQQSGVTSQLLAGSAPSDVVCWVVGNNSTILRTADGGATWIKVPNPQSLNGVSVDWVGVFASDALDARINSVDGKRFSTTDGGQTWTAITQ